MSLLGQVLCQRMVIGPACPLAIIGNPTSAAPVVAAAAPLKNLRRDVSGLACVFFFRSCLLMMDLLAHGKLSFGRTRYKAGGKTIFLSVYCTALCLATCRQSY